MRISISSHPWCVACGSLGATSHHVLERDDGGDDVPENLVTLCGSGTSLCHGAMHGSPYVATTGGMLDARWRLIDVTERRDHDWVAQRIGAWIEQNQPETVGYVIGKLGPVAGRHYLRSRYGIIA